MAQNQEQRQAIEARRRRVAGFLMGHATQEEMARREGVSRKTISNDVKALREMWRKELIDDPVAIKAQELAELNDMERDCIRGYALSHDRGWIAERRLIKERKAKLLGLDAPVRQEHSGQREDRSSKT